MNRNGKRRQSFRAVFEVQDDLRAGATAIASAPPSSRVETHHMNEAGYRKVH